MAPVSREEHPVIGSARRRAGHVYYAETVSACPECRALVNAKIIVRDGKVYFHKLCPAHGHSEALVSTNADWYFRVREGTKFKRPNTLPEEYEGVSARGCPHDCGLCPDHQGRTCSVVLSVTNACDLRCPVCVVSAGGRTHLELDRIKGLVTDLIKREKAVASFFLYGGEPTMHPDFLEILRFLVNTGRIRNVNIATNGLRLAADEKLLDAIAQFKEVTVGLQFDGFTEAPYLATRGRGVLEKKLLVLERLRELRVDTNLVTTLVKGVNEDCVGEIIRYAVDSEHVSQVTFQPVSYWGRGRDLDHDPLDRITTYDVLVYAQEQTGGMLTPDDFHADCAPCTATAYLYVEGGRAISVTSVIGRERMETGGTDALPENITEAITTIKAGCGCSDGSCGPAAAQSGGGGSVLPRGLKRIIVHAMMDLHTFDVSRVRQCCSHFLTAEGRRAPQCAYNIFHRDLEEERQ